jgi:hypothetical protein
VPKTSSRVRLHEIDLHVVIRKILKSISKIRRIPGLLFIKFPQSKYDVFLKMFLRSLTHLWSWTLLEKPPIVQLPKNFPEFYGTRMFITVFIRALNWSLFWARSIQSVTSNHICLRSILIWSTHLRLGLPSGLSFWLSHQYPIRRPLYLFTIKK